MVMVISTHNGPQMVFKYPPTLSDKPQQTENEDDEYKVYDSDSDSENTDDEWDKKGYGFYSGTKKDLLLFLDDQEKHRQIATDGKDMKKVNGLGIGLGKSEDSSFDTTNFLRKTVSGLSDSQSSHSRSSMKNQPELNQIFGIDQDYLVEMLCPPKEMCNARFEINIDNYVFLGLPVHCYDNGTWKKKTKNTSVVDSNLEESIDSPNLTSMNMFHLVFIMNPPVIEKNYRIDEMYHYVISRLSLVLRHEQSRHDYVWAQTRLISRLKEEFKTQTAYDNLTSFLIDKCSLCKLISDCFIDISKADITNLSINNKLRSFQIPIKTEFCSIPESTVPFIPGSHLSSTVNTISKTGLISVGETTRYGVNNLMSMVAGGNMIDNDGGIDEEGDSTADDIIYLALLLLDDPETIIRDLKAEPDLILANFIRMIKPTESLLKLSNKKTSTNSALNITQIKSFAYHLIYWRRARVIPPLNIRAVYIVSPMAPITINLYEDIRNFKSSFPTMPSLPQFLKLLSSPAKKPRQFITLIPSKDHRDLYLEALAWLLRFGYVSKLQTFIWLKVSKRVRIKVEEDMENESTKGHHKKQTKTKVILGTDNTSKVAKLKNTSNPSSYEDRDIEDIAFELKNQYGGPEILLEDEDDTIILDPGRANAVERRWINKIVTEECKLSPELTTLFYNLLKYMNGKTSLELLMLKEELSRNDFRRLILQIEDHIISVRHW